HFTGQGWNKGMRGIGKPRISLKEILTKNSSFQSYKLKKRLFKEGLKKPQCEECGWAKKSKDGRIPLELDHVNGTRTDNRLENLRVLCPNCHSLKPTHRGLNKKKGQW
ncbi:HNH endonuclease, partial [Patescibacteria group bacterium]